MVLAVEYLPVDRHFLFNKFLKCHHWFLLIVFTNEIIIKQFSLILPVKIVITISVWLDIHKLQ